MGNKVMNKATRVIYSINHLKDYLYEISKKFNIIKIVLFGSRARGDFHETSDIDLAIYGNLSSIEKSLVINDIESLPYLFKFDIIFIDKNTNKELLKNIENEGIFLINRFQNKLENFSNSVQRLNEAIEELKKSNNSIIRDGVIQRFEFTVELAWKTTREFLIDQGFSEINTPQAVMKEAFTYGIVDDGQKWIMILEDRNLTSHIYSESVSIEISHRICNNHILGFQKLLKNFLI